MTGSVSTLGMAQVRKWRSRRGPFPRRVLGRRWIRIAGRGIEAELRIHGRRPDPGGRGSGHVGAAVARPGCPLAGVQGHRFIASVTDQFLLGVEPWKIRACSLPCHHDAQAFLGRDEVVEVLCGFGDVELDPADPSGECRVLRAVVVADRGAAVAADLGGLVD